MIPKVINYIFGLDENFCNKPFHLFHYLNILSAYHVNNDYIINFYYKHLPNHKLIKKLEDVCNFIQISDNQLVTECKFSYTEHISDLLRLNILNNSGGIYLDIDTVCINKFDNLLDKKCVLGIENIHGNNNSVEIIGLCNACILSEPNMPFINRWIDTYKIDYKCDWNYNSVKVPYELYKKYPSELHVENSNSFFKYSWDNIGTMNLFDNISDISDCYSIHLWEHKNYNKLQLLTEKTIETTNSTLANIYKMYI